MWNIVAFSIIVSGCSVSPYCVLGTLFLCVLSVGSPLVNCIQLSTCRLVFTLATFLSAQCRLILFLIRVLSLFVKVIQLRVRGLWVLRIYILSISGGVLSSNWSLCLKLPLCLLILELDASNYRLVHTLNYRRFFFSLARSCLLIKLWPRSSISITSYLFLHLLDDESYIKLTCTTVSCTSFLSIVDLRDIIFWYIGYDKYMIEVNTRRHPANIMVMLKSFVLSNILPKIK